MKIKFHISQLVVALHLLFWFISFNFWNVILNPGVESTSVIQGFEVEWDSILLVNLIFIIYCLLPFIWLVRKARLWLKIPITLLFLIPLGYVILEAVKPDGNKEDVASFVEFFIKNLLYVVVFHLSIAALVYFNLKVLIPRFLNKSRFAEYLTYVSGLCISAAIINFSLYDFVIDKLFPSLYYISYFRIWELFLIMAGYLVFTSVIFLIWQYGNLLIERREAARNELSALKAQINPHFLFNNLNTIYSMAEQKDRRTPEVILKLSDFLRYVLYDTSSEKIPLGKEVEMIETYVGLQKERINPETTTIKLEIDGDFSEVEIAPLLLLPLAENCFKHGVGKSAATIRIQISFDGSQLLFKTENRVMPREKNNSEENGGIGIRNVEKRLNLIYPNRHSLKYNETDGIFRLQMKIDL